MTDIRLYHLERSSIDTALPQLLHKALQTGERILIKVSCPKEAKRLDEHLWTYDHESFLPHSTTLDGNETDQPVFITNTSENINSASILFLTGDLTEEHLSAYQMVCDIFDGRNPYSLNAARTRWKIYREAGFDPTYWQQTDKGWEKKA